MELTDPLVQPAHEALEAGDYLGARDYIRTALEKPMTASVQVALRQALAIAERELGRLREANEELTSALDLAHRDRSVGRAVLVRLRHERALTLALAFHFEQAAVVLRYARLNLWLRPRTRALSALVRGLIDVALTREDKAIKRLRTASRLYQQAYGPRHALTLGVQMHLAVSERSTDLLADTLKTARASLRTDHPSTYSILLHTGYLHLMADRHPDAQNALKHALDVGQRALPPEHVDLAINRFWLARASMSTGAWQAAETLLRDALQQFQDVLEQWTPGLLYTLFVRQYLVTAALHNRGPDAVRIVDECWQAAETVIANQAIERGRASAAWLARSERVAASNVRMATGLGTPVGDLPSRQSLDRFTYSARWAAAMARRSAATGNADHLGNEHILLGLLSPEAGAGMASRMLERSVRAHDLRALIPENHRPKAGAQSRRLRSWWSFMRIGSLLSSNLYQPAIDPVPPRTESSRQVFLAAFSEADSETPTTPVGTHHLLMALAKKDDGIARRLLDKAGYTAERIRAEAAALASDGPTEP